MATGKLCKHCCCCCFFYIHHWNSSWHTRQHIKSFSKRFFFNWDIFDWISKLQKYEAKNMLLNTSLSKITFSLTKWPLSFYLDAYSIQCFNASMLHALYVCVCVYVVCFFFLYSSSSTSFHLFGVNFVFGIKS